jgi:hypothetical protein
MLVGTGSMSMVATWSPLLVDERAILASAATGVADVSLDLRTLSGRTGAADISLDLRALSLRGRREIVGFSG